MTRKIILVTWYDAEEAGFDSAGLKHGIWDCLINDPQDLEVAKTKVTEELKKRGIESFSMKIRDPD